jgi:hypothetical protein
MNSFVRSALIRKIMLILALLSFPGILLLSLNSASANPDTTWSVSFQLNMTKAVNQHIFLPDSDYLYVTMDHGIQPMRLVPGPGYTYTGTLVDQLDTGVTYQYKFRINDSVYETVNRQVFAQPGMVSVTAWWNNEPLNITTFIVNMEYAVQYGLFNPVSDSVCIVGTMNSLQGPSKMQRMETTLNYTYVDTLLVPGSVQQYKYRINADSSGLELLYKPARIIRIPDTLLEVTSYFNNFNPATRLMTFRCDMAFYVKEHFFDVTADYLDVAGNFNGSGANDALFDTDGDTIYTLDTYIDTSWFHQGPLEFKFRINGNWNTAELPGKPDRTYVFHDTIQQNPNIFGCYYNNQDPSVPTPPWVYDVSIQGPLVIRKILSGIYSYASVNGIPEGISTYRWLRSSNAQGTDATPIDSAWKITYVVDTLDIGKWLVFEITPVAASGDSATGMPVRVISTNSISAWDVGMAENSALITRVYPNPFGDYFTVAARQEIEHIELVNYLNQTVLVKEGLDAKSVRLTAGYLPRGFYLLKAVTKTGQYGVTHLIKY